MARDNERKIEATQRIEQGLIRLDCTLKAREERNGDLREVIARKENAVVEDGEARSLASVTRCRNRLDRPGAAREDARADYSIDAESRFPGYAPFRPG